MAASKTVLRPRLGFAFFCSETGGEPVREWLKSLDPDAMLVIGRDMKDVQLRWPISLPLVDGLGDGLYEVRSTHNKIEYRVLFCIANDTLVALHGFVKKTQRTPPGELKKAQRRKKLVTGK